MTTRTRVTKTRTRVTRTRTRRECRRRSAHPTTATRRRAAVPGTRARSPRPATTKHSTPGGPTTTQPNTMETGTTVSTTTTVTRTMHPTTPRGRTAPQTRTPPPPTQARSAKASPVGRLRSRGETLRPSGPAGRRGGGGGVGRDPGAPRRAPASIAHGCSARALARLFAPRPESRPPARGCHPPPPLLHRSTPPRSLHIPPPRLSPSWTGPDHAAGGAGAGGARYVPPALRAAGGDGDAAAVERRITGLLNRRVRDCARATVHVRGGPGGGAASQAPVCARRGRAGGFVVGVGKEGRDAGRAGGVGQRSGGGGDSGGGVTVVAAAGPSVTRVPPSLVLCPCCCVALSQADRVQSGGRVRPGG